MTTTLYALFAIIVSVLPLMLLAWRDPKRLGGLRRRSEALGPAARRGLAVVVLLPGVALGVIGQWPAFLIWLGAISAAGWLLAQMLGAEADPQTETG